MARGWRILLPRPKYIPTSAPSKRKYWSRRDDLTFELEAGTIAFGFETELGGWGGRARPWIEMRLTEPLSLREWIDRWVHPLNRLVTFATGRSSDIVYLVCLESSEHGDHSHDAECAVLGSGLSGDVDSIRVERSNRFGESWITPQDVGTVWPAWTAVLALLEVGIEFFLETVIRRGELSERHSFLNLVQAAESVHSSKHPRNQDSRCRLSKATRRGVRA